MTKSNPDIILYGGPGSGKGTQAELLLKKIRGSVTLNMGAALRELARKKTPAGQEVKRFIDAGKIAPVKFSTEIFEKFLASVDPKRSIILDGYPRTVAQLRTSEKLFKKYGRAPIMVYIKVPRAEVIKRLLRRAALEHRQDDTNRVAIQNRLKVFQAKASLMVGYFRKHKRLITIDGNASMAQVHRNILSAIR